MTSLRSTRVVLGDEVRPATVRYQDGVVVEIGDGSADLEFGDLVVMPGLVDSHVHVNEPGRTEWEGFATATRAAAAGGTTTIVDMPLNSVPPTVDLASLEEKRARARGRLQVDTGFWGGLIPGSAGQIGALVDAGVCGFKAFLADSGVPEFPPVGVAHLEQLELSVPLLVHAEEADRLGEPKSPAGYREYLESRPAGAESAAIEHLYGLGGPVHILHVSSGEGVEAIGKARGEMTGETCPHYLLFSAEDIPDGATEFKCAPPIREATHREALWDGLAQGRLQMVVSDHSPSPPELKEGNFATAWGGISSLQLRLPATWTGAATRSVGLARLAEWLATAPARLAGLAGSKGTIEPGRDADFVVWDPDGLTRVRGADLEHRHPLTPYEGMRLRGEVVATILRGTAIYEDGSVVAGHGRMLRRP
ncbi:MAG: allantoinase AllB [Actinobacteria bacterium]|nr:allantoinase AllB [Actinomycetota bacterium]